MKPSSVVAATVLIAGTLGAGVAAHADNLGTIPPGCAITATTPSIQVVSSKSKVKFGGYASCINSTTNYFRLVHNYNGVPDVRVTEFSTLTNPYSYSGTTCDHGPASTEYYSEVGWHTASIGDVQRISSVVTLNHC